MNECTKECTKEQKHESMSRCFSPLVCRSISCWALSRYAQWIVERCSDPQQDTQAAQAQLDAVLQVSFKLCLSIFLAQTLAHCLTLFGNIQCTQSCMFLTVIGSICHRDVSHRMAHCTSGCGTLHFMLLHTVLHAVAQVAALQGQSAPCLLVRLTPYCCIMCAEGFRNHLLASL